MVHTSMLGSLSILWLAIATERVESLRMFLLAVIGKCGSTSFLQVGKVVVRNSLPTRSSLDGGCVTWVLKAEICGGYDESNEEGDDDGLYRQRCGMLSIP